MWVMPDHETSCNEMSNSGIESFQVLLIPFHPSPQICRAGPEIPKIAQKRCTATVTVGQGFFNDAHGWSWSIMVNHDDPPWLILLNHHKPASSWLSLPGQLIAPGAPQRKKRPSRTAIWFEDDVSMTGSPGTPVICLGLNGLSMICQNFVHCCIITVSFIPMYHNVVSREIRH